MPAQDNINCLKNLMQLMCADGVIDAKEKAFLGKAAEHLAVSVDDWNALLKEVLRDKIPFYPILDRGKAVAALKTLIVMSKADSRVDEKEKRFALQFAQSIGISKAQWKQTLAELDAENLFAPFQQSFGRLIVLKDDFEKLDAFLKVAQDNGATVQVSDVKTYLQTTAVREGIVCFHAAADKDMTVARCQSLMSKAVGAVVCILNRFQGLQVKYLHETGLKTCVIEPANAKDIAEIVAHNNLNNAIR